MNMVGGGSMYSIGLDVGTTSAKAVLFTDENEVIDSSEAYYPLEQENPVYAEQDPEMIFDACLLALRQLQKKIGTSDKVAVFGMSAAMHSLIAVDDEGSPLTKAIIWADNRSQAIIAELKQTMVSREFYQRTGTPIHPMSWLGKLKWLKENQPTVFNKTAKFISIKEFICKRLFGEYVVDESIAGGTGLYHLTKQEWDQDILAFTEITEEQLSKLVPTTYELTRRTALGEQALPYPDCRFFIGASDGVLANVGTHALTSDVATVTIGTSGAVRVHTGQPLTDLNMRTFCYALTSDSWIAGGATNNGGLALQWYIEQFAEGQTTEDVIKEALTVPPGANGLFFLPFLNGERAPYWNSDTRGAFIGISRTHQRAHFSRAVLEGVLFSIQSVLVALEETVGPVQVIHASGGFARSSEWVQMLADITGKRVRLPQSHHASALGAVRLAKHALGLENLFNSHEMSSTIEFEPVKENGQTYKRAHLTYEKLYQSLEPIFPEIIKQQQVNNNIIM